MIAILLALSLVSVVSADDDEDDDDDDESILGMDGEGLGEVALFMMIATTSVVLWKPAFIWLNKNAKHYFSEPKLVKAKARIANLWYMRIHYWLGLGVVIVGGIHGLALTEGLQDWLFWLGWVGLVLMSITGALMLWKWPPRKVRKGARMLHAQRALLVITIVALVASHELMA